MSVLIRACTAPITDIAYPLITLTVVTLLKDPQSNAIAVLYPKEKQLQNLILATFRITTVAGLFFVTIPFNYIFGNKDKLSSSVAFAYQFLIHPYAAALYQAFSNGGYPFIIKTAYLIFKRQFRFTREDVGGMFLGITFCVIALPLKNFTNRLDRKYVQWSKEITQRYYSQSNGSNALQDEYIDEISGFQRESANNPQDELVELLPD